METIEETGNFVEHKTGSIVGIQHIISTNVTNITSAIAKTMVYVGHLRQDQLASYINQPGMEEKIWRASILPLIHLKWESLPALFLHLRPE